MPSGDGGDFFERYYTFGGGPIWKVISLMKKNLSRFLKLQNELHGQRPSNSAKFGGTIVPRKKQHGKEKLIFGKTTLTYLLANPNLEGKIHHKGVRFVTSQKSLFQSLHIIHAFIIILGSFSYKISKTEAFEVYYFM